MKRIAVSVALVVLIFTVAAQAQTPVAKPGPEHKKLEIWVGDWTYEGEDKATPLGPAGKHSGKITVRPILDGFFVEFRGEVKRPSGAHRWLEIDGYDPVNKRFTFSNFGSDGVVSTNTYTIDGNTISFSGTEVHGEKPYKVRGTGVIAPDLMSWVEKWEVSVDGKTWIQSSESKFTKTKPLQK